MTIEEIFHAYEFNLRHGFINNADKYREQIIAALRAGQAMRKAYKRNVTGTPVQINLDADKAAQAWDAATSRGAEG